MKTDLYDTKGKQLKSITPNKEVFDVSWNESLVHQVAIAISSNNRKGLAHTKDRSEVRGGGKKPWAQKGTGRARHGSSRSPIWTGGGVTFGPRKDKNYSKKVNRKMRAQSLYSVLSKKLQEKNLIFIDAIEFDTPKTKSAVEVIKAVEKAFADTKGKLLVVLPARHSATMKSFANIPKVEIISIDGLNTQSALTHTRIAIVGYEESEKALLLRKNN